MTDVADALVTQLTTIVTNLTSALTSIAPLAVPLIGIGLVVTIGIGLFKRIASRA